METKVCKCCGRALTEDNTSKAYKNLCKDCYAAMMRDKRFRQTKEKAEAKETPKTDINWESVRINAAIHIAAAKAAMPDRIVNYEEYGRMKQDVLEHSDDEIVDDAVSLADKLVARLKRGGYTD